MNSLETNSPEPAENGSVSSEEVPRAKLGGVGVILVVTATLVIGLGIFATAKLIPQAIERSESARQEEDVTVRTEHETAARSSLVLGVTALVCTVIALLSIVFPFVGRHDVAALLLGSCVASSGLITLIFKPF